MIYFSNNYIKLIKYIIRFKENHFNKFNLFVDVLYIKYCSNLYFNNNKVKNYVLGEFTIFLTFNISL